MAFSPFRDNDTFTLLRRLQEETRDEIRNLQNDYVLRSSVTELETYFIEKTRLEPITLLIDERSMEEPVSSPIDVRRDQNRMFFPGDDGPFHVPGTKTTIIIPFTGNQSLWRIRPSSYNPSGHPSITVASDTIRIEYHFADDTATGEKLRQQIERNCSSLKSAVDSLRQDIERHNAAVPEMVKVELNRKRQQAQAATNAVSAVGIPIRRRNQQETFVAPVTRRKLPNHRPIPAKEAFAPEPVLSDEEYQHINQIIRSVSKVAERSPKHYADVGEEQLRDFILFQLNGHYEGAATGETFNHNGKTDILIRVDNRNIFIAECKFWHGQQGFTETIDQLLGYLTWRDCKCSLVIFNKNKDR
jgi:hypothetical protein